MASRAAANAAEGAERAAMAGKAGVMGGRVDEGEVPGPRLEVGWATEVFNRPLDDLTPAVTIRRTAGGQRRVTVLLNEALAWDAYEGDPREDAAGRPVLDLRRVLESELARVFLPVSSPAPTAGAAPTTAAADAISKTTPGAAPSAASAAWPPRGTTALGAPASQDTGIQVRALAPCDPNSGYVLNPRMLTFQSPDDWAMSGYQVGIFPEGHSSPERTIDLGREAFLIRRVVDIPGGTPASLQQSFVTMIQTAGLTTATGVPYTYRVRGVWSGGTTAWSEPSGAFVRCPGG